MNKKLALSIVFAAVVLVGCAASGPKLASSLEDIAGTWSPNTSTAEVQIDEDGTYLGRDAAGNTYPAQIRFEGTRFIYKDSPGGSCTLKGYETGIYEIELLENGNLKFTVIEDECPERINFMAGRLAEVEFEPVP